MTTVEVCERCRRVVAVRVDEDERASEARVAVGDHVILTDLCDACRRRQKETTERLRRPRSSPFEE